MGLNAEGMTWDFDQLISTRFILESGYCTLPKDHGLWAQLKLEYFESKVIFVYEEIDATLGNGEKCACVNLMLFHDFFSESCVPAWIQHIFGLQQVKAKGGGSVFAMAFSSR